MFGEGHILHVQNLVIWKQITLFLHFYNVLKQELASLPKISRA